MYKIAIGFLEVEGVYESASAPGEIYSCALVIYGSTAAYKRGSQQKDTLFGSGGVEYMIHAVLLALARGQSDSEGPEEGEF
ncbi:hypothetical protein ANCCEY_07788 [Ancylostoma ceylanicum]|uniref:Uncharacterized protein n=1 Tax=Ancylostoma ceylanicum TaxID=53326 RepID=A0A0D6LPJ7_9BILA|nr:hypothetical protein ANCCEY_07788 [Ancylostoma ceylanicum]